MNRQKHYVAAIAGIVALVGLGASSVIEATPPLGISFTPVARATLPEFMVKRKDHGADWSVRLDADQEIDVATQIVTFPPGAYSGWHTHPGPVFFTVRSGTLTVYEGEDPLCESHVFPAGTGAVEAGSDAHSHMVRNETAAPAEAVVTYIVPVGTPQSQLRTDLPNPGNCPF